MRQTFVLGSAVFLVLAGTTRTGMTEKRGRCDRTTTAGVRLDEGKPPSSSLACTSVSPFWLSPCRLRPNFVAAEPPGTEDHLQLDGNPKNVG